MLIHVSVCVCLFISWFTEIQKSVNSVEKSLEVSQKVKHRTII